MPTFSKPHPARSTKAGSTLRNLTALGPRHRAVAPPWRGYALHAMTFSAGYDTPAYPTYDFHGLKRGQTEWALLQYTHTGQGMLRYENNTHTINPGQAMLLTLPHDHRYWCARDQPWSFFYLCMQGSEILRAWQHVIQQTGPIISLASQSDSLKKAIQLCTDILDNKLQSPWTLSARTYDLAMSLVAMLQDNRPAVTSSSPINAPNPATAETTIRSRPRTIQKAIDLARKQPENNMNVEALAHAAGLSRHHFSRLFAQSEGMGPGEYLARVRLRQAVRLLQTTELPIKRIASNCGFHDPNYFAKAFRKAYGLSPRDFRSRGLGRPASNH